MTQTTKIIVGFDHSAPSREAFRFAAKLAGPEGQVRAVIAMDGWLPKGLGNAVFEPRYEGEQVNVDERIIQRTREVLSRLTEHPDQASIDIRHVQPSQAVRTAAHDWGADLIVVGATGQGAVSRWLLGSTASRLVRQSQIPVLVHHPTLTWPVERIVCPVDFSPPSDAAMEFGVSLARRTGAQLTVFHANPSPLWGRAKDELEEEQIDAEEQASTRLASRCDVTDLNWTCRSATGVADRAIVADAQAHEVQLICMGTVGRSGLAGVLVGNTAERVMRAMPCAILTVRGRIPD